MDAKCTPPCTEPEIRPVPVYDCFQCSTEGGGGGGGAVTVTNFPETQAVSGPLTNTELRAAAIAVSGPLTNAQLLAVTGAANATAWDGAAASATVIPILKAIHDQNVQVISLLTTIAANTAPTP